MNAPYSGFDAALWLEKALGVLALRLHHEVAITRALRGPDRQEGFLGLFLSDEEAEAMLAEVSGRLRASGTAAAAAEIESLHSALDVERRADPASIWRRLADLFGLAEAELDLLTLAAAPALDPRIGRVYGYLNDDMGRRYLTPALALRLLDRHGLDMLTLRRMLAPEAPLMLARLVTVGPERPLIEAALRVEEGVLDRLLGHDAREARLTPFLETLDAPVRAKPRPQALWLLRCAPPSDPGSVAMDLAAGLGLRIMLLEQARFAGLDTHALAATLAACMREARLDGALPILTGFDACSEADRREVAALVAPPAMLVTAAPALWEQAGMAALTMTAPPTASAERARRIAALLDGHPADSPALRALLRRLPRLGLLSIASLLARHDDADELRAGIRDRVTAGLVALAEPVISSFTLNDLVLPAKALAALRALIAWQDTAPILLDDWGLGRAFGKRASTTALFRGPSGTGKTMAASAVANALGLPLFRVDLAALVSKYIGETEKNLDRLFQAAEAADVVLFFDEADAIFGRRSEVQDAHDRYANLETSYLLQRLESHDGISILASNLQQNIDEAFLRRIDTVVDFPAPGKAERLAIWRRIDATTAPVEADLDLGLLAERFELTGGEIRNCWLDAAQVAARRSEPIGLESLMQAVGRELLKQAKPIRKAAFGEYFARLRPEEVEP